MQNNKGESIQRYYDYQTRFFSGRDAALLNKKQVLFVIAQNSEFESVDSDLLARRDHFGRFLGHYIALLHGLNGLLTLKFYLKDFGLSFWHQIDDDGMTPLHYAVFSMKNDPVADFFRDFKLDFQARNRVGHSVADLADLFNRTLLSAIQSLTFEFSLKVHKMFVYAKKGDLHYIKELIGFSRENALLMNFRGQGGRTLLHVALQYGWSAIVDFLLSVSVNVNALDQHGNTPLHYAVLYHSAQPREQEGSGLSRDNMVKKLDAYDTENASYLIDNGLYSVALLLKHQAEKSYQNNVCSMSGDSSKQPFEMTDEINLSAILVCFEALRFQLQAVDQGVLSKEFEQSRCFWSSKYWYATLGQMPTVLAIEFLNELKGDFRSAHKNEDFKFPPLSGVSFQEHYAKLAVQAMLDQVEAHFPRADAFSNPSFELQKALDLLRCELVDDLQQLRHVKFGLAFEPRQLGPNDSFSDNTPVRTLKRSFSSDAYTCLMRDLLHDRSSGVFIRAKMIMLKFRCMPNGHFLNLFSHLESMVRLCLKSEKRLEEHENYTKRQVY